MVNGHVGSGLTVLRGGLLDLEGATVSGGIAANGANTVRICVSTINGGLTIVATTGFVVIGDPAHGCAANVIKGSLTVVNNHHGVVIINNTITGGFLTTGNSGCGPLPGQPAPIIAGNHH
ncbi:MAG: hypothetical protein M3O28_12585 [Actinomycetota bacterium]|nr:hypothetical protein [Actinomycetota bacterium]